jgi:CheY-like chemotaxis protein
MQNMKPILLVEDDNIDARIVKRALDDLGVTTPLIHLTNGEEALLYLRNNQNQKPCIILLDLNMPRMNGFEFLRAIKDEENLKTIPVIVLTTSREGRDILETFDFSVAGYVVKPLDYHQFVETMKTIERYWSLSQLPVEV